MGIVDQTIIWPYKVDERVKLNCVNYWDFMNKTLFVLYKSQSHRFKSEMCIYVGQYSFSCIWA